MCSCHSAGVADALASVLIFAADASTRAQIELLGVAAWHDEALGVLPTEAAVTYGDYAFVRMMWLKVTSVYLVSALGHNVLFQDADVVWLRNPITYFADVADKQVDTSVQRPLKLQRWCLSSGLETGVRGFVTMESVLESHRTRASLLNSFQSPNRT